MSNLEEILKIAIRQSQKWLSKWEITMKMTNQIGIKEI